MPIVYCEIKHQFPNILINTVFSFYLKLQGEVEVRGLFYLGLCDTVGKRIEGPWGSPQTESVLGHWNIMWGSRVWRPVWASSHLSTALSVVIGFKYLPLVQEDRVVELTQQLLEEVLVAQMSAPWLLELLHASSTQGEAAS